MWRQLLHTDWVCQLQYISELNSILSCSLDKRLCLADVEARVTVKYLEGHTQGVRAVDWSKAYSFIASGGLDRNVMLWNPFQLQSMATLQVTAGRLETVLVVYSLHSLLHCIIAPVCLLLFIAWLFASDSVPSHASASCTKLCGSVLLFTAKARRLHSNCWYSINTASMRMLGCATLCHAVPYCAMRLMRQQCELVHALTAVVVLY